MKLADISHGYEAFVLTEISRQKLMRLFPPKNPKWIGHHITHKFGVARNPDAEYGNMAKARVVGYASRDGLEALVVEIKGSINRPDGKIYHITWSLDPATGAKPVDSNNLIAEGWSKVQPIAVDVMFTFLS